MFLFYRIFEFECLEKISAGFILHNVVKVFFSHPILMFPETTRHVMKELSTYLNLLRR